MRVRLLLSVSDLFLRRWMQARMTAIFNPFSEAGWCPWVPVAQVSTMFDHCFRFGGCGCVLWNHGFSDTLGMTMPAQGRQLCRSEPDLCGVHLELRVA